MRFGGEKSYRLVWLLILLAVGFSLTVAFLPALGFKEQSWVKPSSFVVVAVLILGILALMIYMRTHLRAAGMHRVTGEQVLPDKLAMSGELVGTGRKLKAKAEVAKRDRWKDGTCKETFVRELCTTCIHYRRRYYGNFCKHFGMVVDKPKQPQDVE